MPITISTINLCLGLKNKKLLVKRLMDDVIDYDWLNLSLTTFKLRSKALFLTNQ